VERPEGQIDSIFQGQSKEGDIIAWCVGEHRLGGWYGVCVGIVLALESFGSQAARVFE